MLDALFIFPWSFWVVVLVLVVSGFSAARSINNGAGIPTIAVLATVAVWYVGDAYYNDYAHNHAKIFSAGILQSAWCQVALFLVVFTFAAPRIHKKLNFRDLARSSGVINLFKHGVDRPSLQLQLQQLFKGSVYIWVFLTIIAVIRLRGESLYYFCPYLGYVVTPWGRGRLGTGFDAIYTVMQYVQMINAGGFGVFAALSKSSKIRWFSLILCFLTWPAYIFDRTRSNILVVVVPSILSFAFFRIRGGIIKKLCVLLVFFALINSWFSFIIAHRSEESITSAIHSGDLGRDNKKGHHDGLNMFEELCWINTFIEIGTYRPNWGSRYFAELVNPIPRVLWPGKPMIGIDYAVARGQGLDDGGQAGVGATMSTGMIGQGVVNFGRILGPVAAALLMSLWVATLAHFDLNSHKSGLLPLYMLGLILTFNLGRDITLITLYSFTFGWLAIWLVEKYRGTNRQPNRSRVDDKFSRLKRQNSTTINSGFTMRKAIRSLPFSKIPAKVHPQLNKKLQTRKQRLG